ncbi:hypothetical protein BS50DRAFT_580826 [Corynespora cassiicola Philippines]|uniref:Uncharacterized protein n=1 Tax=Corynespora cassiicola Philippines TaxID=1448308 RepID=A0A2T2P9D1_CORCC|nr:hypothetical protein BS50DRAFT_580826 [Corynespora cassiicola Philippines]
MAQFRSFSVSNFCILFLLPKFPHAPSSPIIRRHHSNQPTAGSETPPLLSDAPDVLDVEDILADIQHETYTNLIWPYPLTETIVATHKKQCETVETSNKLLPDNREAIQIAARELDFELDDVDGDCGYQDVHDWVESQARIFGESQNEAP